MSEPRTALDLADALASLVVGKEKWNRSCELTRVLTTIPLRDQLAAIPADAAEQIARLKAEVEQLRIALDVGDVKPISFGPPPLRRPWE